jgi:hypothetical protein
MAAIKFSDVVSGGQLCSWLSSDHCVMELLLDAPVHKFHHFSAAFFFGPVCLDLLQNLFRTELGASDIVGIYRARYFNGAEQRRKKSAHDLTNNSKTSNDRRNRVKPLDIVASFYFTGPQLVSKENELKAAQ